MRTKFNLAMFLTGFAMTLHADSSQRGFTVSLRDCTELIGLGPVDFAKARSLVPISYSLVPFNGSAGLVVRASRCAGTGVDSSAEKPAIVAQVGIAIIPPDGTGDINNYTLLYATDHQQLAQVLNQAGLPAVLDRALAYELTPDSNGHGEVYVGVSPALQPAWFLTGAADTPPSAGGPVVANWWFQGSHGVIKMSTSIASIRYGAAGFSLHTSKMSVLGGLIGGNTDANFVFFNALGAFTGANLAASVK
jgi:hypothetical protein